MAPLRTHHGTLESTAVGDGFREAAPPIDWRSLPPAKSQGRPIMSLNYRSILLALVLLAAAGTASAADAEGDRAVHYPLTMARMQAFYDVQLNLIQAAERDP